jgi:hypothetical protein
MSATKPAQEVEFEVVGKESAKKTGGPGATGGNGRLNSDPFIALIAQLMDNAFVIPGTKIRFGLDPIIGLIPALGATATSFVSLVMIFLSAKRGVPKVILARMAVNVLANAAIDSVPVVGDILSIFFRSNARNYELLLKHAGPVRQSTTGDWIFLGALFVGVLAVIGLMIVGSITMLRLMFPALAL